MIKAAWPSELQNNLVFDEIQSENSTSTYMKSFDETTGMHINCYDSSTYVLVKRGIRIANLNICHILNKMDELKILLSDKRSVDILGVCEPFLNDDILDALITAGGFNFERKDRNVKFGGGILVYVSHLLNYKRRFDIEAKASLKQFGWKYLSRTLLRICTICFNVMDILIYVTIRARTAL